MRKAVLWPLIWNYLRNLAMNGHRLAFGHIVELNNVNISFEWEGKWMEEKYSVQYIDEIFPSFWEMGYSQDKSQDFWKISIFEIPWNMATDKVFKLYLWLVRKFQLKFTFTIVILLFKLFPSFCPRLYRNNKNDSQGVPLNLHHNHSSNAFVDIKVSVSSVNFRISLFDRRKLNRYFSAASSNALSFGPGPISKFHWHLGTLPCKKIFKLKDLGNWENGKRGVWDLGWRGE
jgi:hypothetical protein